MKKLTLTLALTLATSVANAGILIEPYLAYESGQNVAIGTGGDVSSKTTGMVPGLRLAYTLPILLWFGVDYSLMSGGTARPDTIGSSYNIARSDLYAVVGFDFPILVRGWIGYGLANSMTHQKSSGTETYSGGTNYKLGVGLSLIPLFNITVETYKHESNSIPAAITGTYADAGFMVGVSFPIDL